MYFFVSLYNFERKNKIKKLANIQIIDKSNNNV